MANKINITMDQGADFEVEFSMEDRNGLTVDLSTYTGEAQMRQHHTSTTAVSFDVDLSSTGVITLTLPAANTMAVQAGRYVYDVELTDSSNVVTRVIEGIVTVTPNVTR